MAEGSKTQILVAVISVSGVIAAALISNSDKIFGARPAPTVEKLGTSNSASGTTDGAANLAASQARAYQDAASPIDNVSKQIEATDTANIGGVWSDSDGYRYDVTQQGNAYSFRQFQGGFNVGGGAGSISGRTISHNFTNVEAGNGTCQGELSPDGATIEGGCRSLDGRSWTFRIVR